MAPDPHAKYTPVAVAINGKLYVHGFDMDAAGGQSSFVARLGIYDLLPNTWSNGSSPDPDRSTPASGQSNGKMYVVGGCILSDCSFPTNKLRSTTHSAISGLPARPCRRCDSRAAAGVINGELYVTGGTLAGYASTKVTEIYNPA